jgi:glutathione S-transferase
MSMKLYYSPAACSLAAHIAAKEGGLALDLVRVDLKTHRTEHGDDYRRLNPKGYVPALELDDGSLLTENVAILPYLADQSPEADLAPPPQTMARTRLLEWLAFLATELHKAFGPIFHHGDDALKAEARETIEKWLAYVAARLADRDFLMGAHFSVADAYLFVMLRWLDLAQIPLSRFPVLVPYHARIAARPAVQAAMKEERLKL